jgi:hypothetical protein
VLTVTRQVTSLKQQRDMYRALLMAEGRKARGILPFLDSLLSMISMSKPTATFC